MKSFLLVLALLVAPMAQAFDDCVPTVRNRLRPFTTDGCSKFPEGIPVVDSHKWAHCCFWHDVAYWAGGTAEERLAADFELYQCVAATGERAIAYMMFKGVRVGGHPHLPTPWRWGYGWERNRGYEPLTEEDLALVHELLAPVLASLDL